MEGCSNVAKGVREGAERGAFAGEGARKADEATLHTGMRGSSIAGGRGSLE